jgi:hypothetical protein
MIVWLTFSKRKRELLVCGMKPAGQQKPANFADFRIGLYMTQVQPNSPEARFARDNYAETLKALQDLQASLASHSQYRLPPELVCSQPPNPRKTQPMVNYAFSDARRLGRSLETFMRVFYAEALNIVFSLSGDMTESHAAGTPVIVYPDRLALYFQKKLEAVKTISRKTFKLRALKKWCEKHANSPRFPQIPLEHLTSAMKASVTKVIDAIEFSPRGFYDDFFAYTIESHPTITMLAFDAAVREIDVKKSPKSINFAGISDLISTCAHALRPKLQTELFVLKDGVYRVFFDRFYLLHPSILDEITETTLDMSHRCEQLKWMTPREATIPEQLILPSMADIPFVNLVAQSPDLQKAVDFIAMIPFLTNPIDIMGHIFLSMKHAEDFIKQNVVQNKFGQGATVPDEGGPSVVGQMSFDEFFPVFCLVFAYACPSNACPVMGLLCKLGGIPVTPSFDFAKLLFTSAIEYFQSLDMGELRQRKLSIAEGSH